MIDRFTFSWNTSVTPTILKVCFDFVSEPVPTGYVDVDVSFAPSGGSVVVVLSATEPCANVIVPKGAITANAHDLTVPQWSDDHVEPVP